MLAGLLFPLLLLVTESAQLGLIATPFYVFVGMVVTAYIGGAVVDDHWLLTPIEKMELNNYQILKIKTRNIKLKILYNFLLFLKFSKSFLRLFSVNLKIF